jgi:hypothetical protein
LVVGARLAGVGGCCIGWDWGEGWFLISVIAAGSVHSPPSWNPVHYPARCERGWWTHCPGEGLPVLSQYQSGGGFCCLLMTSEVMEAPKEVFIKCQLQRHNMLCDLCWVSLSEAKI